MKKQQELNSGEGGQIITAKGCRGTGLSTLYYNYLIWEMNLGC
jgi:hypothetical protein